MKVIAVKTMYLTDENNDPVPEDTEEDELPCVYHGPFDSLAAAEHWVYYVYPDGDEDVHEQKAGWFDIDEDWLNDPASIDEDIRRD